MNTADLLKQDLTDVSLTRPVIQAGNITVEITDARLEPNKAGDGDNLHLKMKTVYEQKGTKGEVIEPGYPLEVFVGLTPRDKYPVDSILKQLKRIKVATGFPVNEGLEDPSLLIGRQATVKLTVSSDAAGEFDDRNEVSRWVTKQN